MEEVAQKRLLENKKWQESLKEHFTGDLFNLLDAISICISLGGMALYLLYVLQAYNFETEYSKLTCADRVVKLCPELPPTHPQYGKDNQVTQTNFISFVEICRNISTSAISYVRVSAINTMLIGLRMLKFFRTSARMIKLNTTLWNAVGDTVYLILWLFIILLGFTSMGYRSFGSQFEPFANPLSSLYYCMDFVIGNIEWEPLEAVDPLMAVCFVFPMLFAFHFVLLNMFFAITDRWYIVVVSETDEVPSFNWKAKLKPYLGEIFTFIEWDEEFEMQRDPEAAIKPKPPSRKKVVEEMKKVYGKTSW